MPMRTWPRTTLPTVNPGEVLPAMEKVETASEFGSVIHAAGKDYRILFPKDTLDERK